MSIPINLTRISWAPGMEDVRADALHASRNKVIAKWLHEKRYKAQHCKISYRMLNDWTDKKLVEDDRARDSQSWRSFSRNDLLWIKCLMALRDFGLSHDKLQTVRHSLGINKTGVRSIIDVAALLCLKRYPTFIVVFEDGHAEMATANCLACSDKEQGPQSYIRINFNKLFRELIRDSEGEYQPKLKNILAMSVEELSVLEALREQGIDEIMISKKSDKIARIDSTKHVDGAASVIDHIRDIEFGDIDIRVEGGKQRHTKITKRRKLD